MNADQVGYLASAINPARTWAATGFALSQTDDQLLTKLVHRQSIDGVVDRLATDVCIFNIRKFHGVKLAGNLLGRKAFTQQINH